jgi:hypothetical protein
VYIVAGLSVVVVTVGGIALAIILKGASSDTTPVLASVIGFAGTIVTVLVGLAAAAQAASKSGEAVTKVDEVNEKVNGHLTRLTSAVTQAAATNPEVAANVADILTPPEEHHP